LDLYPVHLLQLNSVGDGPLTHLVERRVYVYYETRVELEFDGT
jgi:hypothetical protein